MILQYLIRIGAKKAWGNLVASGEYLVDSSDENAFTIRGKYYFSGQVFAGLGMSFIEGETATGVTLGYTF